MIVQGLTRAQVESVLGVPAGNYDWAESDRVLLWSEVTFLSGSTIINEVPLLGMEKRTAEVLIGSSGSSRPALQGAIANAVSGSTVRIWGFGSHSQATWTGRHGALTVWFDDQERVISTSFSPDVKIVPPWKKWRKHWLGE